MSDQFRLCLIGAGNMGGAMLSGWLEAGIEPGDLLVIDPQPREEMAAMLAGKDVQLASAIPDGYVPDVLLIAVKPQMMDTVLPAIAKAAGENTVCVSVAAGTTIARLEHYLGEVPIVRSMPNTPALLRRGITVCCANSRVSAAERHRVTFLLDAIGKTRWVAEEGMIDAVTAVSGSGPAYVFHLAECMTAAAIAEGLPEDLASDLARETIAGAGAMLSQLSEPAATLRQNVTSPNGTTAAALARLMGEDALCRLVAEAIHAARKRSEELSA